MCICTKDYNKKQKVEALNRKVKQIAVEEVATKSTNLKFFGINLRNVMNFLLKSGFFLLNF
jgi:hypothetical protein